MKLPKFLMRKKTNTHRQAFSNTANARALKAMMSASGVNLTAPVVGGVQYANIECGDGFKSLIDLMQSPKGHFLRLNPTQLIEKLSQIIDEHGMPANIRMGNIRVISGKTTYLPTFSYCLIRDEAGELKLFDMQGQNHASKALDSHDTPPQSHPKHPVPAADQ